MSMTLAARLAMSAACIAVGATPVLARDANRLQNLVGARAGSGEAELERHGFTYIGGHEGQNYVHSYWWHAGDRNCVEVKTADGRYDAIVNAPNRDCNQRGGDKAHREQQLEQRGAAAAPVRIQAFGEVERHDHADQATSDALQQAAAQQRDIAVRQRPAHRARRHRAASRTRTCRIRFDGAGT